jgi:hypothetical protein
VNLGVRRLGARLLNERPYCTARVVRLALKDGDDPLPEEFTPLPSFDEVVAFLKDTYQWFAEVVADRRASGPSSDATESEAIGGFGVDLTNRMGGVVMVGVGRRVWLLARIEPKPVLFHSDHPELDGTLVFYLDGWHHTEMESDMLVSRGACLAALRVWLDSGQFPTAP